MSTEFLDRLGTKLAALSSIMLYLRNHVHPDRDAAGTAYLIDINVAKGCKVVDGSGHVPAAPSLTRDSGARFWPLPPPGTSATTPTAWALCLHHRSPSQGSLCD